MIDRVAYLALHSCPLMQPGSGDAGGMNVYIKELSLAMADQGVEVSVENPMEGEPEFELYALFSEISIGDAP